MIWMFVGYAKTYIDKCCRDHIGAYAAQTAYFMIMSSIPFMMLLFAIMGFVPSTSQYLYAFIYDFLPIEVQPYLSTVIEMIHSATVGTISVSTIMAIWSSGKAFQNLMVGLNVVNQIEETRNWFVTRILAVIYTFTLLIAIVIIMLMLVFTDQIKGIFKDYSGIISYLVGMKPIIRWIFVYIFLVVFFTYLFKVLPNQKIKFAQVLPGGIICATSWYIFSAILSLWIRYFNAFSMYGTLAAIMSMMFWLYFCMYFMLMSAEANVFFGEMIREGIARKRKGLKTIIASLWTKKN